MISQDYIPLLTDVLLAHLCQRVCVLAISTYKTGLHILFVLPMLHHYVFASLIFHMHMQKHMHIYTYICLYYVTTQGRI